MESYSLLFKNMFNLEKTKMFIKVRPPMFSPKTLVHFPVMYMPITALPHFPTASLLKGPLVLLWKGPEAPPQGFLVSVLVLASCHYLCG